MKRIKNSWNTGPELARSGSALITVMIVATITFMAVGSLYALSASMAHQVRFNMDTIRARAIAEAGANKAYSILRDDYSKRNDPEAFPTTSFAGGEYRITVNPDLNGITRITSTGEFGRSEATLGVDVRDANEDEPDIPEYLEHAIFSNADLLFNGDPTVNGSIHLNGFWTLNGSGDNINGTVTARNENSGEWSPLPFPKLSDPDFQELLAEAEEQGRLTRYDGNETIRGDRTFNGIVVVDGNLTFQGSGTRDVNGLLYVTGDITSNGSGTMNLSGALLAGGDIRFNGSAGIFTHESVIPHDDESRVVVSGWWN